LREENRECFSHKVEPDFFCFKKRFPTPDHSLRDARFLKLSAAPEKIIDFLFSNGRGFRCGLRALVAQPSRSRQTAGEPRPRNLVWDCPPD
jgi:hypothetical protein